ncbi:hypothetical protein LCGC14_1419800 [marine sediment metagenome]|uniref:Uncharacterized protein n=1 Tax=marine sediment metagenome TaxID=412755 RepID=A0A0F9MTE8_9ZZZZ
MCGEIDEQVQVGQDLLEQLRVMARMRDLPPLGGANGDGGPAPTDLASPQGRAAYMEAVFQEGLTRSMTGVAAAQEDETVDALASQAIALARLAGFLAGQLPPEADLFRALVEALSVGHAEPHRLAAEHRAEQDRQHGHSHDHGEDHGHSHSHNNGHDHSH